MNRQPLRAADIFHYAVTALLRQRFRAGMVLLAMSIGVASVVALTGLAEGARNYVLGEFSALGKDILVVFPGRKEASGGGMPPVTGNAARELTLEDAQAIVRGIPAVSDVAPLIVGNLTAHRGGRGRDAMVLGTSRSFVELRQLTLARGANLPDMPLDLAMPVCVIGEAVRRELFGSASPIGEFIRLGDARFRVIGLLAGRGDASGMNLEDAVIVPVASAQQLFNVNGLFRLMVRVKEQLPMPEAVRQVESLLFERHDGERDVTVITPDAILATFNRILTALSLAVAGIAGISLVVAGVLTMNVTLITVQQRVQEIGLLKALGASATDVQRLFLSESALLSACGACLGALVGELALWAGRLAVPAFPMQAPGWVVVLAVCTAAGAGLLFSFAPAHRAARVAPVAALQRK